MKDTARLEARVPIELYLSLKEAAALQGRSITDFVVHTLRDATRRTIEDAGIMRLAIEDQRRFAQALIEPPEPNAQLRRGAEEFLKHVEPR